MSIQNPSLLHLIELDHFRSHNNRTAIIYDGGDATQLSLSWRLFAEISDRLGTILQSMEIERKVVSIAVQSSHFLVPPMMTGILKAGGVFSYLDIELPKIRQDQLLSSAATEIILAENNLSFDIQWKMVQSIELMGIQIIILKCTNITPYLSLGNCSPKLAYIVHTSGSTGTPKTVQVPHDCILPNILDLRECLAVTQEDIIFMASPFTFDPSIVDIFLSLSTGASLLIVDPKLKRMPVKLGQILNCHKVTLMQATPSLFLQFSPKTSLEYLLGPSSSLRALILGGEPFPSLEAIRARRHPKNRTEFYNIYGITEVSCWATITRIDTCSQCLENPKISLGKAMKSTTVHVLNDSGEETSEGEGHLHIGGRFCLVGSETVDSMPLLRPTGDLVEVLNGDLFFKGRIDDTVKRMGQRFTYYSVEHLAMESGLVSAACAFLDARKILFLAASPLDPSNENQVPGKLEEFIKSRASKAEIPDEIVVLPEIPVSQNGKTNRNQVAELVKNRRKCLNPRDWEGFLLSKWRALTGSNENPNDDSNFVFLGGNSMSALELVAQMEDSFGRRFPQLLDNLLNRMWAEVRNYVQEELISPIDVQDREVEIPENSPFQTAESVEEFEVSMQWKFNLKKCIDATPFVMDGSVFIGSHSHLISGIDWNSGNPLWITELPDRIESTATGKGNRIFVGCYDGRLYCLNASAGDILWSFQTGDHVKCSPVCHNERLYFGSHDQHIYCVDLQGRLVWKKQFSRGSVFSRPFCHRFLFAASLDGTFCALCLHTGNIVWTFQCPKPIFGGLSVCEENVLVPCVDGTLYARRIQDGRPSWNCRCGAAIFSTPRVFGEQILFGCHDNFVYCADGAKGSILWRVDCSSAVYATPFVCDFSGRHLVICCSTKGQLLILDLNDGRMLARLELPGEVFSSPVVCGDRIMVGCRDDFVYCFRMAHVV